MRVVAVIPALNEERSLPKVLADIPRPLVEEVIVADNGSTDRTAYVARAGGATVVSEPRAGYGRACLAALSIAATDPPDIVVFVDADYSDRPAEMPHLLEPIIASRADLVIGSRVLGKREPGALAPHARWGNWLATCYSTLQSLDMKDQDYGWTAEMQAKAARAGVPSTEVPVSYHRRVGKSKITGTVKGTVMAGWKIITTILRIRLQPPPAYARITANGRSQSAEKCGEPKL